MTATLDETQAAIRSSDSITPEVIRVRWWWFWVTAAVCAAILVAGLLVTYRPVAHGQWSEVSRNRGSLLVSGGDVAQEGEDVEVAVPGDVIDGTVISVQPAEQGQPPTVVVELDEAVDDVVAGDPVSVRFAPTPVLRGLIG